MSDNTKIEWCDATWNPLRGCSEISPGCINCYAKRMCARGLPGLKSPSTGADFAIMTPSGARWTGDVELIEDALAVPLGWRKPRRVFVNSMSDTFHKNTTLPMLRQIFQAMRLCERHTFMVLTKRSKAMRDIMTVADDVLFGDMSAWPAKNVWLGVSVESRQQLGRIDDLRGTPAALRFLSLEPLLEDLGTLDLTGIGWVIVGGESGPGARMCDVAWIRSIVEQCAASGVPCFVKQLGDRSFMDGKYSHFLSKCAGINAWPEDIRVRQIPEQNGGPTK